MGKKKAGVTVGAAVEADVSVATPVVEAKHEKGSAKVVWSGGVREYSKDVHGADFAAHAKEFAEKKGGKVV